MTQPTFDVQAAMQAELEQHLAEDDKPNRKNGSIRKTMKSLSCNFELNTPRDRNDTFTPQVVKKHQTDLPMSWSARYWRHLP